MILINRKFGVRSLWKSFSVFTLIFSVIYCLCVSYSFLVTIFNIIILSTFRWCQICGCYMDEFFVCRVFGSVAINLIFLTEYPETLLWIMIILIWRWYFSIIKFRKTRKTSWIAYLSWQLCPPTIGWLVWNRKIKLLFPKLLICTLHQINHYSHFLFEIMLNGVWYGRFRRYSNTYIEYTFPSGKIMYLKISIRKIR